MKVKRYKKIRKILHAYQISHNLHAPYKIACDGEFIQSALAGAIMLKEQLPKLLQEERTTVFVTPCIDNWLRLKGATYSGALHISSKLDHLKCRHEKGFVRPFECIKHLIANGNPDHLCVAAQDEPIRKLIRHTAGVPLLFIHGSTICMEAPTYTTKEDHQQQIAAQQEIEAEELKRVAKLEKKMTKQLGETTGSSNSSNSAAASSSSNNGTSGSTKKPMPSTKKKKKKGPSQPNPLSMKKKKKQGPTPPSKKKKDAADSSDPSSSSSSSDYIGPASAALPSSSSFSASSSSPSSSSKKQLSSVSSSSLFDPSSSSSASSTRDEPQRKKQKGDSGAAVAESPAAAASSSSSMSSTTTTTSSSSKKKVEKPQSGVSKASALPSRDDSSMQIDTPTTTKMTTSVNPSKKRSRSTKKDDA